jgi:type I restriction enzyme, S subunit
MNLEIFFEKFDIFADAPDAVAKMRELVLELSASGGLIPEELERPVEEDTKLMGAIAEPIMGQAPAGDEYNTDGRGTVFVKVGEFGPLYPREQVWTTNPLKFAKTGDVLVCVVGATVGKLNLAIDCAIGRSVAAIRPSSAIETKFLYYSLMPYTPRLRRNSRGSAQGVIGKAELNAVSLWVPSLNVQKRIVAKVDEVMALCDGLEAQQQEREQVHAALAHASLARFADAPTAANLNFIFHKSYNITPADLRRTILSLAVQGKLVPQDPNDEPADVLLTRIRRVKGGTGGDLTRSDELPNLDGGFSPPFDVPSTWVWVRATEPTHSISDLGKKIKTKDVVEEGRFPVIDQGKQFIRGYCDDEEKVIRVDTPIVVFGDHTRETKLIEFDFIVGADGVKLLKPIEINPAYYLLALRWLPLDDRGYGRHFKLLRAASIPIPPLAEQHRIVAKVDELMALVNELETQLAASHVVGEKLFPALVAELTAGKESHAPA